MTPLTHVNVETFIGLLDHQPEGPGDVETLFTKVPDRFLIESYYLNYIMLKNIWVVLNGHEWIEELMVTNSL